METKNLMSDNSWLARIKQIFSESPEDLEDLKAILQHAAQEELLEANTLSMLEGVLDVQETRVKDVMVPRTQMVTIEQKLSLDEIVPLVARSGHSRYPVIGDTKDEVVGILLAKDLLSFGYNYNTDQFDINKLLRTAVFIPESKRLNVLLQEFRLNRNHMAIVVDEYGRITGLITIEDVLEQIVGEIEDEHDTDSTPSISPQAEGTFTVKALTPIEDFNAYFDCSLGEEDVETIGGLIMRNMGRLPKRGESVKVDGFNFTVLRADNRRIYLLSVTPKKHVAHTS
jgi:magnesium and cobalt transporter